MRTEREGEASVGGERDALGEGMVAGSARGEAQGARREGRATREHTSRASYLHVLEPSSRTSLHHLSPTISRPVTFFTVQKSNASRSTHMTKTLTKLEETHVPNM